MIMGFEDSLITFMRAMELTMIGLYKNDMKIYLDDITVLSEILETVSQY
jgi:hypothetical protein